jgi:hypothetical protein
MDATPRFRARDPRDFHYGWREAGIIDPNGYLVILGSPL